MNKGNVIYIKEYYSSFTKKEIVPFVATWESLEDIVLTEIGQTQKGKYCMVSLLCGI